MPHLGHAHQVPVVSVAVLTDWNLEVEVLVVGVGLRFAQVPLHAAGAQHWARHAQRDAIRSGNHSDIFRALDPDAIRGEQFFVLVDLRAKESEEVLHFLLEAAVGFVLKAANAEGVRGEPCSAIFLVDLQNLFAVTERIEKRSDGADIERMRAQPELVAGNAVQFSEDHAHMLGPRGRFHVQ